MITNRSEELFDVSIFIVTENDIIPLTEYDYDESDKARFIMLTNEYINPEYDDDNTICISTHWYEQVGKRFVSNDVMKIRIDYRNTPYQYTETIEKTEFAYLYFAAADYSIDTLPDFVHKDQLDLNGYKNTMQFLSIAPELLKRHKDSLIHNGSYQLDMTYIPPIETIEQYTPLLTTIYKTTEDFKGKYMHGYLPAQSQMLIIAKNIITINTVLSHIYNIPFWKNNQKDTYNTNQIFFDLSYGRHLNGCWWTSTYDKKGKVNVMYSEEILMRNSFFNARERNNSIYHTYDLEYYLKPNRFLPIFKIT